MGMTSNSKTQENNLKILEKCRQLGNCNQEAIEVNTFLPDQ